MNVHVRAGAFRAEFEAQLRCEEFAAFRKDVAMLYDRLDGEARFETAQQLYPYG